MRKLGFFLVLVGCLTAVPIAMAAQCPTGQGNAVIVTIDIGSSITVTPSTAEVWMDTASRPADKPYRVCWVVTGLDSDMTVHTAAKDAAPGLFSGKKFSIKGTKSNRSVHTAPPDSTGNWGYSVWVTRTGQNTPLQLVDPVIIIKEGIGGGGRP